MTADCNSGLVQEVTRRDEKARAELQYLEGQRFADLKRLGEEVAALRQKLSAALEDASQAKLERDAIGAQFDEYQREMWVRHGPRV
jgi:hypothetical protein